MTQAIKIGNVVGVCLDVLEYESSSFDCISSLPEEFHYLVKSDKVIMSPHIAGKSFDSELKIAKILAKKIIKEFEK